MSIPLFDAVCITLAASSKWMMGGKDQITRSRECTGRKQTSDQRHVAHATVTFVALVYFDGLHNLVCMPFVSMAAANLLVPIATRTHSDQE